MPDRDLRLNSVSRYSKESPRLVLEEHGHCEIPAGCGGVVLRWFNPLHATPLEFWMYVNGEVKFAVDGTTPISGRPLLEFGEHVLSFAVSSKTKYGILMFAALAASKVKGAGVVNEESVTRTEFLSDADGSWKYTLQEPIDDAWMKTGFDDTAWQPLVLKPIAEPVVKGTQWYRHHRLIELGAQGLGLDESGMWIKTRFHPAPYPLWIRRVFQVTPSLEK